MQDTQECCNRFFKKKKVSSDEQELPIMVLTDVLLSLLIKPCTLPHSIAKPSTCPPTHKSPHSCSVIKAFRADIIPPVLEALVDVLVEEDEEEEVLEEENTGENEENMEDDNSSDDLISTGPSSEQMLDEVEEETINMDDEDEETLAKYDEMLSQIFKQRKSAEGMREWNSDTIQTQTRMDFN